mmetsp:Transcript_64998/g.172020  ORF Transcript_64998/g.172020 Transcript_64998/m.172020 type:complete len:463 (-) Transcript_64998:175-1563(-)|eukprot:CAMPEP_0194514122 /NCGR_PEP_ID=MMETSP0253-20130528/46492_1 /TAXON_ID=2966 /ORGANISM="Noctiluca scintillans" /LENGTH=462 /DNA_ID=CAMNT_0039357739 /DNA_START=40 /DNA_END=1428 /DNA_ORIENTATION=+
MAHRMSRARTVNFSRQDSQDLSDLDFMVTQFTCHDDSMLKSLGRNSKQSSWNIEIGHNTPIHIELSVDRRIVHATQVGVVFNNTVLFPTTGKTGKLMADFEHSWPFRGTAQGLNVKNMYELRIQQLWYPATLTKQLPDGRFDVRVDLDHHEGARPLDFFGVDPIDIREMASKKKLQIPQRELQLFVPKDNPLKAVLFIDGGEGLTHYFCRQSPRKGQAHQELFFQVDKGREHCTCNMGNSILRTYLRAEVMQVPEMCDIGRHAIAWGIQVGAFARHKIEVERAHGRIVTVTVDGEILVQTTAEDIDCEDGKFSVGFKFVGERAVAWDVYQVNADGDELNTRVKARTPLKKYTIQCHIILQDESNLLHTQFFVDSREYGELPQYREPIKESALVISPSALQLQYGLSVPWAVDHDAATGVRAFAEAASPYLNNAGKVTQTAATGVWGYLLGCCSTQKAVPEMA